MIAEYDAILPPAAAKLWTEAYTMKVPCKTKVEIMNCKVLSCVEPTNILISFGANRRIFREYSVESRIGI